MIKVFPTTAMKLGFYPIVDNVQWIASLLEIGVRSIQLRIKNQNDNEIEKEIFSAVLLAKKYNCRLFINDYWHLAIKYNCYGVHLGQEDLYNADLRAIYQAGLRLGLSTHNDTELDCALALGPSYIALGHIFPTKTKYMPSPPQGLLKLKQQLTHLQSVSTVAIGGISLESARKVLTTGVGGIAVASAITHAINWRKATYQFLNLVKATERGHKL